VHLPVLETDFIKALVDPKDVLHRHALRALEELKKPGWRVASSAFLELDLLLKNSGIDFDARHEIFESIKVEIPKDKILILIHETLSLAIDFQSRYRSMKDFYFDSIHLATATLHDAVIASSDHAFDQVREVNRISLDRL
jgi:predicted nucleic acid-binding protein